MIYEEIECETFVSPGDDTWQQEVVVIFDSMLGFTLQFTSQTDESASPSILVEDWGRFKEFVDTLLRQANKNMNEGDQRYPLRCVEGE
jgi:hypothetical protein